MTAPPKRMLAAMEKGPGPAKYVLPPLIGFEGVDNSKHINPAYSLGPRLRPSYIPKTWGPGPGAYYYEGTITRFGKGGKGGVRFFTLGAHIPPLRDFTNAPGPGAYRPTKYHLPRAPAVAFKSRVYFRRHDEVPPPNTYNLPPTIGADLAVYHSNAGFSQRGRVTFGSFQYDYAKTPGPACCRTVPVHVYRRGQPQFSILGRLPVIRAKDTGPGPVAHRVEKVIIHKPIAPRYSFGRKHSEFVAPVLFAME